MKKSIVRLTLSVLATAFFSVQCSVFAKPEVNEVISIDFLDIKYVFIFKTKCINIEGVSYPLGARDAMSFENSSEGREALMNNISEPFLSVILGVWDNSEKTSKQGFESKNKANITDVYEITSIGLLDNRSATILKSKHITIEGIEYTLGEPRVISYENSAQGRQSLSQDASIPQNFTSAVMAVWGDTPTVIIPPEINPEEIIAE